ASLVTAAARHRCGRQRTQPRPRREPREDPRRLAPIERVVLLGVVALRDQVPPDLLLAAREVAAQPLCRRVRRVAIPDEEIRGQPARRARLIRRRLPATMNTTAANSGA